MLLLFVPLVNMIAFVKVNIDLAKAFHQGAGFGIGLALLSVVFYPMLAFGNYTYGAGCTVEAEDVVSRTLDDVADRVSSAGNVRRD